MIPRRHSGEVEVLALIYSLINRNSIHLLNYTFFRYFQNPSILQLLYYSWVVVKPSISHFTSAVISHDLWKQQGGHKLESPKLNKSGKSIA